MPIGYRYYQCQDLPRFSLEDSISSVAQLGTPWGDDEAHSRLTYVGPSEHPDFERYQALHQVERSVDAVLQHTEVRALVFNERFPVYYHRQHRYFLASASRATVRGFFERLKNAEPAVSAKAGTLDLARVRALGQTTGAWFSNLKINEVSTAGIFGTVDIDASAEWGRYADVGDISALHMRVASRSGVERAVQVTRDRLVLLWKSEGELDNLDFVAHLQELFEDARVVGQDDAGEATP